MEDVNPGDALAKIMNVIYDTNVYLQHTTPWDLKEDKDQERLNRVIYLCAESIRICGILLRPFMPDKMSKLLDMIGVADDARLFANTEYGSDRDYGEPKCSVEGPDGVLFSALTSYH